MNERQKRCRPRWGTPWAAADNDAGACLLSASIVPHSPTRVNTQDLDRLIAQAGRLAAHHQRIADKHAAIYAALRAVQARHAATRPKLPDKKTWQTWADRSLPRGDR